MASPQPTDSHLRLANSILEALTFREFSKNQLSIIYFILRLSYACGKKFALIKNKAMFRVAGVHPNYIAKELEYLEKNRGIIAYPDLCVYVLNKNYEDWTIPYKKGYSQKAFNELISKNLNLSQQFIETINNLLSTSTKNVGTPNKLCLVSKAQNTDTEQEKAQPITSVITNSYISKEKTGGGNSKVTIDEVINLYHSLCSNLPQVRGVTRERHKKLDALISAHPERGYWEELFSAANNELWKFPDGSQKRPTLDYLLKEDNHPKLLEKAVPKKTKDIDPHLVWETKKESLDEVIKRLKAKAGGKQNNE